MALNITINKVAVTASFAAGDTVATAVTTGGTAPYVYSLATDGDKFAINSSTGVVTTIAAMDINNISSFSVTVTDSTTGTALTGTSGVTYPPIQAKSQSKFNKPNIIYKITKDIDLGNGVLTIPVGCTLDFQGGSFSNGNIVFSNTLLEGNIKLPLGVTGIITNDEYNVKWFGAKGDGVTDDTYILNWCFNNLFKLYIPTGTYNITNIVIKGDKYGVRWKGDLSYPNKYLTAHGASVLFFHIGSGKMIEFTGNTGHWEIFNICLVTGDNTTHGLYFSPTKQSTFFKTIGVNIWANTYNKVATGVTLGNGFATTFENFNFKGLNIGIDIPETPSGWFTESVIGSAYPSYIIDCNKALNITRARDIIFNNVMIERTGKVIDMISYNQGVTNVTFNNCYFEDYAIYGEFPFNITDKDSITGCSLLINNCTFLYNTLDANIFKSNGNLILQNNRGLVITEKVVSGQFVSLFNEEYYSAYRAYYNTNPNITLFKVDWYNYLGSKNFNISDRFSMGFPNGNINYAQSLRINRRFKVLFSEVTSTNVNVPIAYIPVDTTFSGMIELKVKAFTKNLSFGYSSSSYGTSNRYQNPTTIVEMNTFTEVPTVTRTFDTAKNITVYHLSIPTINNLDSDIYIECEFYTTDGSLSIQPSWGAITAIDSTKYIPNGWRFYDISNIWKKWNGTTWINLDGTPLT